MTRVLTDGAETGDTSMMYVEDWVGTQPILVDDTVFYSGAWSYKQQMYSSGWWDLPYSLTEYYAHTRTRFSNDGRYFTLFHSFHNGTTDHDILLIEARGNNDYIDVVLNGTLLDTFDKVIAPLEWIECEVHHKLHTTNGIIQIKIDGELLYEYTGDCLQPEWAVNRIPHDGQGYGNVWIDDVAVNSIEGDVDNGWIGPIRVDRQAFSGVGALNEFIGSDGDYIDNHILVNETPISETNYLYTIAEEGRKQGLAFGIDTSDKDIKRIWVVSKLKRGAEESDIIKISLLPSGGTEQLVHDEAITNEYVSYGSDVLVTNGDTGLPWVDELEDAQIILEAV